MYIVLILTDTNTQFWKLAKKGESWFRKMFHPIFTTYIPVYFKYNMSNKIERSVISSDRRRSSNSRLSKVVIEAKRLKSHKKACEDFDNWETTYLSLDLNFLASMIVPVEILIVIVKTHGGADPTFCKLKICEKTLDLKEKIC